MEEQKNITWILIISVVMFFLSTWLIPAMIGIPPYYYLPRQRTIWDDIWYAINRVDILLFIATITTGALFKAGFGHKELMYKLTISFFTISMGLLFVTFVKWLFQPQ